MFQEQFNQNLLAGVPATLVLDTVTGEFIVGELVNDGTNKAVVTAFDAATSTLLVTCVSGTISGTITGEVSGATANVLSTTLGGSAGKYVNGKKTLSFSVIGGAMVNLLIGNGDYSFTEGMIIEIAGSVTAKVSKIISQAIGVNAVVILTGISGGTPTSGDAFTVVSSPNPEESNLGMTGTVDIFNGDPSFKIRTLISNDENLPDINLPSTPGNSYSEVPYTDIATQSTYSGGTLYDPLGAYETANFNVETNGAIWLFVVIPRVDNGTLVATLSAFNNYV